MSLTSLSLWISPRSSESEVVVVNSTWRVVSQPPERCRATTQQNMSTIWQCVCVSLCVCITWCHVSLWQKFCVQGQREILDFCQGSRRVGGAGAVVLLVLQLLQLFAYLLQHFCHSREPERKKKHKLGQKRHVKTLKVKVLLVLTTSPDSPDGCRLDFQCRPSAACTSTLAAPHLWESPRSPLPLLKCSPSAAATSARQKPRKL